MKKVEWWLDTGKAGEIYKDDFYVDDNATEEEIEEMAREEAFNCISWGYEVEEQRCRVCGCTWNNACPGGCYWVEEDLCSKCVDREV